MDHREALRALTTFPIGAVAAGCCAPKAPSGSALGNVVAPIGSVLAAPEMSVTAASEIRQRPRVAPKVALAIHRHGDPAVVSRLLDESAPHRVTAPAVDASGPIWVSCDPPPEEVRRA